MKEVTMKNKTFYNIYRQVKEWLIIRFLKWPTGMIVFSLRHTARDSAQKAVPPPLTNIKFLGLSVK